MPKLNAERAIELLEAIGESPRSYSGRGMHGKACVAVVPERRTECAIGLDLMLEASVGNFDLDEVANTFRGARTDAMGRGVVVYWPSLAWPEGRADSKDETEEGE